MPIAGCSGRAPLRKHSIARALVTGALALAGAAVTAFAAALLASRLFGF